MSRACPCEAGTGYATECCWRDRDIRTTKRGASSGSTYPALGDKASRSHNPRLCRPKRTRSSILSPCCWDQPAWIQQSAPCPWRARRRSTWSQACRAAHLSGAYQVGGHAVGLLDEIAYVTVAYWRNYGGVLVDLLLSETNRHGVRAASGWGTRHARRERRHLPRRGRGQIPQTGFSAPCHCEDCHGEKATDQCDPSSGPAHDSCCLAEHVLILAHALYGCGVSDGKGNSFLRRQRRGRSSRSGTTFRIYWDFKCTASADSTART